MDSEPGCKTESSDEPTAKLLSAITDIYQDQVEKSNLNEHTEGLATLVTRAKALMRDRADTGDTQARFLLGQLYYQEGRYTEAETIFDGIKDSEPQALYQLAVMYYDGLGTTADQMKAVEHMRRVAEWDTGKIQYTALYNLGRAYLEGYGTQQSRAEAEKCAPGYWLMAADDGNPGASVEAQSSLGLFYSSPETLDLKRAFFWHTKACGNGSLESQGALGIMYLYGHGVPKNLQAALFCLKEAVGRGNVYAQGHLMACYYHQKLYSNATALAQRLCQYEDIDAIANFTGCLPDYVRKGISMALFFYARCLQLGRGVPQDRQRAQHYYT
ncbi:hypothetical protein P4O66_020152, partial [Electrophorus voltai]